jgi:hypothetical protein
MEPVRTGILAISGWLVAAVLAVGLSWSAISVVRDSVAPQARIADSLPAPEESVAAAPTAARPAASPTAGSARTGSGQGGLLTVRCVNGRPDLINVTPRQGFTADSDDSGVEVQFSSSTHRTEIKATCSGATPVFSVDENTVNSGGGGDDDGGDDHGGGRGGGSGRGGGDN